MQQIIWTLIFRMYSFSKSIDMNLFTESVRFSPVSLLLRLFVILSAFLLIPEYLKGQSYLSQTVLDRVVHTEDSVSTRVPEVARICDNLPLRKRMIDIGDCRLYVEEEGSGIPVVLLHGGPGSTHHGFHPYLSSVSEFARIIYYDQRGCGLSDYISGEGYSVKQAADDLDRLRVVLGIEKWVVLGHSYGGFLAQYYSLLYPGSVMGMILVNGAPGLTDTTIYNSRQQDFISDEEREVMERHGASVANMRKEKGWSYEETIEVYIYNKFLNGDWKRQSFYKPSEHEIARYARYSWKHDFDGRFNQVMSESMKNINLEGLFETCTIPTLIVESLWDLTWNDNKLIRIHRNHPNAEISVFSHSGHSPFKDEPEKFISVVRDFLMNLRKQSEEPCML